MTNESLIPCPFCGGAAGIGQGVKHFFVNCTVCMASTNTLLGEQHQPTLEEAIAAWNRRAHPTPDSALSSVYREHAQHTTKPDGWPGFPLPREIRDTATELSPLKRDLASSERLAGEPLGLPGGGHSPAPEHAKPDRHVPRARMTAEAWGDASTGNGEGGAEQPARTASSGGSISTSPTIPETWPCRVTTVIGGKVVQDEMIEAPNPVADQPDGSREAYEAWAKTKSWYSRSRKPSGDYWDKEAQCAWETWQYLCGATKRESSPDSKPVEFEGFGKWQPIETAPRDGTEFLWRGVEGNHCVIHWDTYRECFEEAGSLWMHLPGDARRKSPEEKA